MPVKYCAICNQEPLAKRRYGTDGLAEGETCPICYAPACRYHLSTVRWRWRSTGETDSARVCKTCQRSYEHRHWDVVKRDWIT
ncbi:MAG: hypothetical protein AAF614_38355 [Chloroflexota bacterium]